jgi:ferrochelatase
MRIETLKSLIGADVLNTPSVGAIENVAFDAKKVKRGDLFFAYDYESVALALANGAYAIIVDRICSVTDNEVAWLRVDSLKDATIKLLRYHLEFHQKKIFLLSGYEYEILKSVSLSNKTIFLQNDLTSLFTLFSKEGVVFLANDEHFLQMFTKSYEKVKFQTTHRGTLVASTLFQCDFIYESIYYKNIRLAPIFLQNIVNAIDFAQTREFDINLTKLEYCDFFYPQFFNAKMHQTEFGKGTKVLIFTQEATKVLSFTREHLPHLKSVYYDKDDVNTLYEILQSNDYVIVDKIKKAVLQLPPFCPKESVNSLF